VIAGHDLRRVRLENGVGLGKLAAMIGRTKGHLSKVERGVEERAVTPALVRDYERVLNVKVSATRNSDSTDATQKAENAEPGVPSTGTEAVARLRSMREGLDRVVGGGAMSEANLADWERTVTRYAAATRHRSSGPLLNELIGDFAELERRLSLRQPLSAMRRLTIVTAQMAGLISLTLLKLNEFAESRHWARSARVAADEAGEPTVQSWVRAQEAYAHYYSGSLSAAISVAEEAQAIAARRPCVGVALAAALEARAQAALGRPDETRAALRRARETLARLQGESLVPSAFGYNEAQLSFHEGNAFTHLHDVAAAWRAQQRALALYPGSDFMDRALIRLDRASCLAHHGDVDAATRQAVQTLAELTGQQRAGLIENRSRQLFYELPQKHRARPAARELQEILMTKTEQGETG